MFIDVVIVFLLILFNLFERLQCASINLIRYHANLYRCGEIIIDEDLIRPLYFYFSSMKDDEYRNRYNLYSILHSLARIETACRTAYLTSKEEMKRPSITLYFVLFNQQITTQIAGAHIDSIVDYEIDEQLSSTQFNTISNGTGFNKNSTAKKPLFIQGEKLIEDDVIELNVGGQRITTSRSTLTAVPKSKLALIFMKNNTNAHKSRDNQGVIFFDYNPDQFNYLLDQLRAIKRKSQISVYDILIEAPKIATRLNFSLMLSDLGLGPEQFLSPRTGAHLNLDINSLVGWQECYRSTYHIPFDVMEFSRNCKSTRFLVACTPTDNKATLTLAGVGYSKTILRECSQKNYCATEIKNGTGFYYVDDQAWGFEGRTEDSGSSYNGHYSMHHGVTQTTVNLNPCDTSDQNSKYRLCWSLRSSINRGGGDRCGDTKNLHSASNWQRIIYQAV
ncbi:unnamed protein product [Adineta steineri]|uniref:Potassium channel tetramerisation-type BTB domain-containing protein n=2 Tax=Adineta steineri TaxID=433720 RepID=A0A818M8F6_9BILA|nr:unnamed protein product [Adineta steineri]